MKLTKNFINDIRRLITSARTTIIRGIDLVQVHTNFEIGKRIIQEEQKGKNRATYGEEVVKALARDLVQEFEKGFSERNLAYMRAFYLQYRDRMPILQSVTAKLNTKKKLQSTIAKFSPEEASHLIIGQSKYPFSLSWTHYILLMSIKNLDERRFYEIEATEQNWTVRELRRQFNSSLYERLALSRNKNKVRKLSEKGQVITASHDLLNYIVSAYYFLRLVKNIEEQAYIASRTSAVKFT